MLPVPEPVSRVVAQWVQKADADFLSALQLLRARDARVAGSICFHAQQRVEKYLKARLVLLGVDFAKTHSIKALMALLPSDATPELTAGKQSLLTDYAVGSRYPSDYDGSTLFEARNAVRIARRVRGEIRRALPRSSLR